MEMKDFDGGLSEIVWRLAFNFTGVRSLFLYSK
jgi:hypothetical protein